MEASEQHRTGPLSQKEGGRPVHAGETLSAVGRLIERADALHLRAPELALVLGERAAALSEAAGADEQWIRAESLVVSARVRLGERPRTVGRAVAALRAAEHAGYGDIAARLRIDLAVCARSLGVPLTGLAALRPVLTDPVVSPVHRAAALTHLVGCLGLLGRKAELDRVLVEADKLVLGDESLGADTQLLVRALLRVGTAAHRRRHGDLTAAADAARTGLGFLEKLANPADDGGLVRIRLVLLLVSTLLDRGDAEMAYEIAEPVLAEPVRAAGVAPMGWLRLAVATRIHLPAGAGEAATELVREAVASTDRHGLSAVTARLWLELAQLEERFGQAEEAIACLYRSRAAEQLHARARRQACNVLAGEFGTGEPASIDLDEVLKAVPSGAPSRAAGSATRTPESGVPSRPVPVVAAEPEVAQPPAPAWSFGREEKPEPRQPAPAWSFERPRVTADAAETSVMPAVRDEPAEPRVRPEPVVVERRRPEPSEAPPTGRRREPERRPEPIEVKSEPVRRDPEPVEVRPVEPVRRPALEPIEVKTAPVEPERRPEPVEPARRREPIEARSASVDPPWRRESPGQARPIPAEPAEAQPSGRRRAPEVPAEPIEVRTAPEPAPEPPREPEKPKFSWAAVAEERLRETAAERESAPTRITPALPLAPEPAAEREPRREPQPSTRHDAEHGSEAARSVLDRLGISSSGGASGGRRRAEDAETRAEEPPPRPEPELAPPPRPEDEPPSVPDYRDEAEPWLPRLRMPPSLEPMEDFGHWTPATAPFPESYARAISEDEPPPDAGLADLLARALAEHQAGTASAAALVKQLGSQDTGRRNGHGRNGHGAEVSDSRRHGSGD
ncbi:hypothetical protein SAMN05421837_106673 [Amycolatopsis pretoriensis]|uniref:Tetratricopeptide repeat-containing protein n=1 Tax=Amycolatopsis pretoriensis TaxID=218821 RepID=A0A1H5R4J7_9PSEU|nr:hypothetical protein [Amycolatopsis pretoriensis]SEF33239.1 hypothetical protein SAMN05421837_106673 [Amycolatopsis pretoriensis]